MNILTDNTIDRAFCERAHPLFIPYITAGDPTPDVTIDILFTLEEAGADIVEMGVPYSDPLADGPVIQAASARALEQGVTLHGVLNMAAKAKARGLHIPLVLFTYFNPILQYGIERLCRAASQAGFSGMIVPDLPLEENETLSRAAEQHGLVLIPLVAPTSQQRIKAIVSQAKGFIYCVSSLGTTGTREAFAGGVEAFLDTVRKLSPVPIAVGFGISKREHVVQFEPHVDATVVGSALVRQIGAVRHQLLQVEERDRAHATIQQFVRSLKNE